MMVFLIIWLVVLTALVGVGFLMVIGKFSKLDRNVDGLVNELFDEEGHSEIEETRAVVDVFLEGFRNVQPDIKNLQNQVQNLPKLLENPSEVSEQVTDLDTRIGNLAENLENLEGDVKLLLNADKEHPVLVPNKGGRPRNEKK